MQHSSSGGYTISEVAEADRWGELITQAVQPHLFQTWGYGEAKRTEGFHPQRLIIARRGEPVAVCQVFEKRAGGLCLASRIDRGPLFLQVSDIDMEGVLRTLRRRWRYLTRSFLLFAPSLIESQENETLLKAAGFRKNLFRRRPGWRSSYLDLGVPIDELRKKLQQKWRYNLKLAERSLSLRVSNSLESIKWIIDRHSENMQQKDFQGPSAVLLEALYRNTPTGDLQVFQVCLQDKMVGGALVPRFGNTAEYYIGWYGPEGRTNNAGNFLMWHAAVEMQRRGCRWFDVGGFSSDSSGHGRFKKAINGLEYRLVGEWAAY